MAATTHRDVINWWISYRWPNRLMKCEHNQWTLNKAVGDFLLKSRGALSVDDIDQIVKQLGDVGTDPNGQLIWIPVTGAAAGPPHRDLFPNLRNLQDCKEYVLNNRDKVLQDGQLQKLNELIAFYDQHKIHRAVVEEVKLTPQQQAFKDAYEKARALVDAVHARDVGIVKRGSGLGPWEQVKKFQEEMHRTISSYERHKVPGERLLEMVKERIAKLESKSLG